MNDAAASSSCFEFVNLPIDQLIQNSKLMFKLTEILLKTNDQLDETAKNLLLSVVDKLDDDDPTFDLEKYFVRIGNSFLYASPFVTKNFQQPRLVPSKDFLKSIGNDDAEIIKNFQTTKIKCDDTADTLYFVVFVDRRDLSFHNFENIIRVDFEDALSKVKIITSDIAASDVLKNIRPIRYSSNHIFNNKNKKKTTTDKERQTKVSSILPSKFSGAYKNDLVDEIERLPFPVFDIDIGIEFNVRDFCSESNVLLGELLKLSECGLYAPISKTSLNKTGGGRMIFKSDSLANFFYKLVVSVFSKSVRSREHDLESFAGVNSVFRMYKFEPGEKASFSNHYDTRYVNKLEDLYSLETLVVYLTPSPKPSNNRPFLEFFLSNDDSAIASLHDIDSFGCVVFPQNYLHAGTSFSSGDKIFLRTELLYRGLKRRFNEIREDCTARGTDAGPTGSSPSCSRRDRTALNYATDHTPGKSLGETHTHFHDTSDDYEKACKMSAILFNRACYFYKESVLNKHLANYTNDMFDLNNWFKNEWRRLGKSPEDHRIVYALKLFRNVCFVTDGNEYYFSYVFIKPGYNDGCLLRGELPTKCNYDTDVNMGECARRFKTFTSVDSFLEWFKSKVTMPIKIGRYDCGEQVGSTLLDKDRIEYELKRAAVFVVLDYLNGIYDTKEGDKSSGVRLPHFNKITSADYFVVYKNYKEMLSTNLKKKYEKIFGLLDRTYSHDYNNFDADDYETPKTTINDTIQDAGFGYFVNPKKCLKNGVCGQKRKADDDEDVEEDDQDYEEDDDFSWDNNSKNGRRACFAEQNECDDFLKTFVCAKKHVKLSSASLFVQHRPAKCCAFHTPPQWIKNRNDFLASDSRMAYYLLNTNRLLEKTMRQKYNLIIFDKQVYLDTDDMRIEENKIYLDEKDLFEKINFASCDDDGDRSLNDMAHAARQRIEIEPSGKRMLLPHVNFELIYECNHGGYSFLNFKLNIDLFNNGFLYCQNGVPYFKWPERKE